MAKSPLAEKKRIAPTVVLQQGQQVSGEELRTYCREKLVACKVPKHVEFCDSLPKTMVGKVLRRELTQERT